MISRRGFLAGSLAAGAGLALNSRLAFAAPPASGGIRTFHASIDMDAFKNDPALAEEVRAAGVSRVWLACFFEGQWHYTIEQMQEGIKALNALGFEVSIINIPLGHPSFSQETPDYMPKVQPNGWRRGVRPDGRTYSGVSIHPPATQQNIEGIPKLKALDPKIVFLDDDFRLAPSPDDIGGCFCNDHKAAYLQRNGFAEARWAELLDDVNNRRYTDLTKAWVNDACDELTASFRAQQAAAAPEMALGNMVMYMGCEKAGIRLVDYRGVPMRVGEGHFSDDPYAPVKGKTNELFSVLFHRRYFAPELSYSETTAWPPDKLSAPNMASKLTISTIADVRNQMFMSGITPFPRTHWAVLAPAMKKQAAIHEKVAGLKLQGPLKHYWGERSRTIGDSNGYSLFLAMGIPFEVSDEIATDGWTFLSDWDAQAVQAGELKSNGTTFVHRPNLGFTLEGAREIKEDMPDLFALKHELVKNLTSVPYVEEDVPAVCAWYPERRAVLVWNLTEQPQTLTVKLGDTRRPISLAPLDSDLLELQS
ncbi:MAG: hypothetical protein RBU21_15375 [FCB group bacterium]|jgi:hypothetical protein|nr:hypothetical protein [FCB group bacterium]